MSVRPQRLPHIVVQHVGDNLLAADAEPGIPQRGFIEERTAIAIAADCVRGSLSHVGYRHGPNALSLARTVLQLFPDVEKELSKSVSTPDADLPNRRR